MSPEVVFVGPQTSSAFTLCRPILYACLLRARPWGCRGTKAHQGLFPDSTCLPCPPPLCRSHAGQFRKPQPLSLPRAFALGGATSLKHPLFL